MTGAAKASPAHTASAEPAGYEDGIRFSLVMPAYNAEATLARAIDSVIAQTFSSWELIVVDDGSTDRTGAVASSYSRADERLRLLSQKNQGCGGARRAGALIARGWFVTKMDADDELVPDALERLSAAIDAEPGYDIYSATGYKVLPDGTRSEILGDPKYLRPLSLSLADLIEDCWIFGGAASIRRSTLERVGGFRSEVRCEDYDLWLRALAAGATHRYVPAPVYLYHVGRSGRMNEYPAVTFESYIRILSELSESGVFPPKEQRLARESIHKLRRRIEQLEESGTTDADYTNVQAARFKAACIRLFGPRMGTAVIAIANRVKWLVRPLRVALARRARRREGA